MTDDAFPYTWTAFATAIKHREELGARNANRVHNMKLAVERISGLVLAPGETFRFWQAVPFPEMKDAFLEGPSIRNGVLGLEPGGGLCQVSSTLFNAFLEANLGIVERAPHSIDAHGDERLLPLGRDSAVAYGHKDLAATNGNGVPLKLVLHLDEAARTLTASILARVPRPFGVRIESTVPERIEPAPPFTRPGWRVETRRHVDFGDRNETNYHAVDHYRPH